jgi:starch phosphorylase
MLVHYVRDRLEYQFRQHGASRDRLRAARHVLDPNYLTFGFARRFTEYKRPNLLLHDAERFARFLNNAERPAQIIIAGKSHPNDDGGKAMVRAMAQFARRTDVSDRVVFLEDYDITLARSFAAGVDVWINNPRRPAEACGTSGMKMIINGGLHFSTLDGWWDEAFSHDVGFKIGDGTEHRGERDAEEAIDMYHVMENEIATEFYDRDPHGVPRDWIQRIRASMTQLTERFSSDRMVRDYVRHAYLPAASAYRRRAADGGALASQLEAWHTRIVEDWHGLRFGETQVDRIDEGWHFQIQVYLGDLRPDAVQVQLYADPSDQSPAVAVALDRKAPIHGAVNAFTFTGRVPDHRPAEHYTPRVVPHHVDAFIPIESTHVCWRSATT